MGEIKSTLDIVMEKTKHLSMTDEEKRAREQEEVRSAIKGLAQKYQDQILSLEIFRKELDALHQQYTFEDTDVLLNEIFSRFNLESDNSLFLKLITDVFEIGPETLEEALSQYKQELKTFDESNSESIRNVLKEKYAISGSAVVSNVETGPSRQTALNDMREKFHSVLDGIKSEIAR